MQKLSFISLQAPCLVQISKKLHFPILSCPWTNSRNTCLHQQGRTGSRGSHFRCPDELLPFPCNMVPTQNCSADTNWVQTTKKVEKLTLLAPATARVPATIATLSLPGERPCRVVWIKQLKWHLTAFGIKVSFYFVLAAFWLFERKGRFCHCRGSVALLIFFPPLFSLSVLCQPHGQEKGACLYPLNHTVFYEACHIEGGAYLPS